MTPRRRAAVSEEDGRSRSASPAERAVIDATDRAIIDLLAVDGRATNRSIAEKLGLPETTLSARVRRLGDRGVLLVTAVSDWEAAGYSWALSICIKVEGRSPMVVATEMAAIDEVFAVALVHGGYDIVAHALLCDRDGLHELVKRKLPSIDGVRDVSVNIITRTVNMRVGAVGERVRRHESLHFPAPAVPMDEMDAGLIEALATDGRQSNRQIARQLGVSEGTIRSRLRRLEEANLVRVVAVTNRAVLGDIGSIAFIGVRVNGPAADDVAEALAALPEVYMVNVTVGNYDLMLSVVTRDRAELAAFTTDRLPSIPGVRSAEVLDVTQATKNTYRWVRLFAT
jgi:DNA-binding Lrp family transcriptional regulator